MPLFVTADASGSTDPIGISAYIFNFGDGTTVGPQAGATATHTYTAGGSFTLSVTAVDSAGASATATRTVVASTPPAAALTVNPSAGTAPLAVTADASDSTPGSNPISTYTFNFGDGTTVGPQTGAIATHTYVVGGSFTVTVTVTDTLGFSAAASEPVSVTIAPPTAAFTANPTTGAAPLAVAANASASRAGSYPIASYTFDFGDGTTVGPQSGPTAGHTYPTAGTFVITVTVTDTAGQTSTATATVNPVNPPSASLAVTPSSGLAPLSVSASGASSNPGSLPIASYTFNFGDGTTVGPQTQAIATHTYTTPGAYTVTLTVTDSGGFGTNATVSVSAASTTIAQDTFARANQSGWGTASGGGTWSAGAGLSIASNKGTISYTGASQFETLGSVSTADGNGIVRFSLQPGSETAGILLREQSNGNGFLARYDGNGNLVFMYRTTGASGPWTTVVRVPFTITAGQAYWLRFEAQGSNVMFKGWRDGTTEPSSWTWSGTNTIISAAGQIGLYGYASQGATVQFELILRDGAKPAATAAVQLDDQRLLVGQRHRLTRCGRPGDDGPLEQYHHHQFPGCVRPAGAGRHVHGCLHRCQLRLQRKRRDQRGGPRQRQRNRQPANGRHPLSGGDGHVHAARPDRRVGYIDRRAPLGQ